MRRTLPTVVLTLMAAALLVLSLRLPVWKMRLEAPQYKDEEALKVKVYPNALRGDIQEIKVLDSYIGVHIPDTLPQTQWLPYVLMVGATAGIVGSFLPKRMGGAVLIIVPLAVGIALLIAAVQAQWQMHEIGTHRDQKTKLVGVKDFTPPLIGRAKIAQFTITSFLGWGSLAIAGALALQLFGAWLNRRNNDKPRAQPPSDVPPGLAANPQ